MNCNFLIIKLRISKQKTQFQIIWHWERTDSICVTGRKNFILLFSWGPKKIKGFNQGMFLNIRLFQKEMSQNNTRGGKPWFSEETVPGPSYYKDKWAIKIQELYIIGNVLNQCFGNFSNSIGPLIIYNIHRMPTFQKCNFLEIS